MSLTEAPPQKPRDELDDLLRRFFRSQIPNPWPGPRLASFRAAPAARPTAGRTLRRSRWALAASVGLLLIGALALPSRFTNSKSDSAPNGSLTSDNELRRKLEQEHKERQVPPKNNNPGLQGDEGDEFPGLR